MRMIFIFSITVMMMSCSDISHVPLWCCNNYQWVLNVWNIFPFVSFNSDTSRPSTSTDESGMSPDEDDDQAIGTFWKLSREYGEMGGGGVIVMYSHTRCMQITLRKPPKQRFDGTLKGTPIKQVTGVNFLKNQCASCHSVFTLSMYNTCISSIFLFISLWYLYCCASFPLPPLKIFKVSALFYHTHQGLSPIKAFFRAIAIHSSYLFRPFFFLLKFYELKTINW